MHYIIGDVHGNYHTLLALVAKLPQDATLIFVGDLIDRGSQSAEVVKFVREGGHACVMGNHEHMMDTFGSEFVKSVEKGEPMQTDNLWFRNGGLETLVSYGLCEMVEDIPVLLPNAKDKLAQFKDDIQWMRKLPFYIELDIKHSSNKPVVVSHGSVATVWGLRYVDSMFKTFCDMALYNRREPDKDAKIFNIFGHTPVRWGADVQEHYVNVDTGCYMGRNGYNQLSAYCVEIGEVVSMEYVS